jgi:hypothetical protein
MSVEALTDLIESGLLAIGLVAGGMSIVLAFRAWRRLTRQEKVVRIGSAFDVNLITDGLQRVREDYLLALHSRPHPRFHPAKFLAAARTSLSRFPYFQVQEGTGDRGQRSEVRLKRESVISRSVFGFRASDLLMVSLA